MEIVFYMMFLLPLIGSCLNGFVFRNRSVQTTGVIATLCSGASLVMALILTGNVLITNAPITMGFDWFSAGELSVRWGFQFDRVTVLMSLVVTGIGTLIHLYSMGYMQGDSSPARYFAYLNLFLFNMLLLISADNLVVLFVGWEGVGLCSYLLIGFWYHDLAKSAAGMKAFVVNRIGDVAFLIGLFLLFKIFGTFQFETMAEKALDGDQKAMLAWGLLFLFIGATGKSAQIPLFTWLPDAMAGPTPVSALIHAATMVTAGLYLIARLAVYFNYVPAVGEAIAIVGALTALLAATIATSQRDIKKVLAYSTVSQLSFMFLAMGVGAYTAGLFHLMTHAFFKALLFLGAGSVIHSLGGEQDLFKMGGLRKSMPKTAGTFLVGCLAICGIPLFAGLFSKDAILFAALNSERGSTLLWAIASFSALLTSFYMARLYLLVFLGKPRKEFAHPPHESPAVMTVPLILLAIGSVFSGWFALPHLFHFGPDLLESFLIGADAMKGFVTGEGVQKWELLATSFIPASPISKEVLSEGALATIATILSLSGILVAYYCYSPKAPKYESLARRLAPIRRVFQHKYWIDEIYDFVFVKPFRLVSQFFANFIDTWIIDGLVVGTGKLARVASTTLSFIQIGAAQFYLWLMLIGAVAIFCVFLLSVRGIVL